MALTREAIDGLQDLIKKSAPVQFTLQNALLKASPGYGPWLRPQNARVISVNKQEREIRSEAPIYVRYIHVFGEDVDRLANGLSVDALSLDGTKTRLKFSAVRYNKTDGSQGQLLRANVSMVCNAFLVRSQTSIRTLKILRFDVYGYSLDQFDSQATRISQTLATLSDVDSYVTKVQANVSSAEQDLSDLQLRQQELSTEVELLEKKGQALRAENEASESDLHEVETQLEKVKTALASANSALSDARNNEAQLQGAVNALNEKIAEQKGKLQALVNDRSLISDEYKDYVEEGKAQARNYVWLSAALVLVLGFCAWQLYSGAARILAATGVSADDLIGQVIQRIPFAAAIAVIVGVCWKLLAILVTRVMKIHADRLALARLLVIAKDTVYSSAANLKVSDQERFKERIRLKLAMLKGHLASDLGRDFVFEPERVSAEAGQEAGVQSPENSSVANEQG